MCSTNAGDEPHAHGHSSPSAAWANLSQPGPLGWKLRRFFANTATKIARRQTCCGNDGEPGC
jgi:hypothetical protein